MKIMSKFKTLTSISGRVFEVRENNKARIFTIKSNGTTYKTLQMTKRQFQECCYNTGNDWADFFKNEYYFLSVK